MVVKVYVKEKCQPCNATKKVLGRAGVAYHEEQARENVAELAELGYETAPVVTVHDHLGELVDHWSGFRPEKCKALADD